MDAESAVLAAAAERRISEARVLLLVAHPDDEVLGASIVLRTFPHLRLIYGTDGSGGKVEVTTARFTELATALDRLSVAPTIVQCGFPDGALIDHAAALAQRLEAWLAGADVLITHAYEGGHVDHDACALAAQLACMNASHAIVRLEFAIYARAEGKVLTNAFPAGEQATVLALTAEEQRVKRRALDAFASQRHVVDRFSLAQESLRIAPVHPVHSPRDPRGVLFAFREPDREERWNQAARRALDQVTQRGTCELQG